MVVPSHERGQYDWIGRDAVVKYFDEAPGKGMLSHEIQKCRADEWCDGADYVLHMDADCMFFRVTRPLGFLVEGRCLSVREEYARITNMNRHIWADVVEKATGMRPAHDYMVRHPQIHPREVYHITRKIVAERAGCAFDQYVLGCQNAFPQGFAEFPTLSTVGAVVMPGAYEYVEYDKDVDAKIVGRDPHLFSTLTCGLATTWLNSGAMAASERTRVTARLSSPAGFPPIGSNDRPSSSPTTPATATGHQSCAS